MQRQKQRTYQPPKATLRLLLSERALAQQCNLSKPEVFLHLCAALLRRARLVPGLAILFSGIGLLAIWPFFFWLNQDHDELHLQQYFLAFLFSIGFFVWFIVSLVWFAQARDRQRARVLQQVREGQLIARLEWPHAVASLLALLEQTCWPRKEELCSWWWGETCPVLVRWLPRLQPGELGARECKTLRKLLRLNHQYEDLQVAILLALGTARDQKARRIATQLFRHSPYERVREAARDCLRELDGSASRRLERRD